MPITEEQLLVPAEQGNLESILKKYPTLEPTSRESIAAEVRSQALTPGQFQQLLDATPLARPDKHAIWQIWSTPPPAKMVIPKDYKITPPAEAGIVNTVIGGYLEGWFPSQGPATPKPPPPQQPVAQPATVPGPIRTPATAPRPTAAQLPRPEILGPPRPTDAQVPPAQRFTRGGLAITAQGPAQGPQLPPKPVEAIGLSGSNLVFNDGSTRPLNPTQLNIRREYGLKELTAAELLGLNNPRFATGLITPDYSEDVAPQKTLGQMPTPAPSRFEQIPGVDFSRSTLEHVAPPGPRRDLLTLRPTTPSVTGITRGIVPPKLPPVPPKPTPKPMTLGDWLSGLGRAVGAGLQSGGASIAGIVEAASRIPEAFDLNTSTPTGPVQETIRQLHKDAATAVAQIKPGGLAGEQQPSHAASLVFGGVEGAADLGMKLSLLGGLGHAATLFGFGVESTARSMNAAHDQGLDSQQQIVFGLIDGLIASATAAVPVGRYLAAIGGPAGAGALGLGKRFVGDTAAQVVGSDAAVLLSNLNSWAFLPENRDKTFTDFVREQPTAIASATISAAITGGLVSATSIPMHLIGMQQQERLLDFASAVDAARLMLPQQYSFSSLRQQIAVGGGYPDAFDYRAEQSPSGVTLKAVSRQGDGPQLPPQPTEAPPTRPRTIRLNGQDIAGMFGEQVILADGSVADISARPAQYLTTLRQYVPTLTEYQVGELRTAAIAALPPSVITKRGAEETIAPITPETVLPTGSPKGRPTRPSAEIPEPSVEPSEKPPVESSDIVMSEVHPTTSEFTVALKRATQAEARRDARAYLADTVGIDLTNWSMDQIVITKGEIRPSRGGVVTDLAPEFTFTFRPRQRPEEPSAPTAEEPPPQGATPAAAGYRVQERPDGRFDVLDPDGEVVAGEPFDTRSEAESESSTLQRLIEPAAAPAPRPAPTPEPVTPPPLRPRTRTERPATTPPPLPPTPKTDAEAMKDALTGEVSEDAENALRGKLQFSAAPKGWERVEGRAPSSGPPFEVRQTSRGPRLWATEEAINTIVELSAGEHGYVTALTLVGVTPQTIAQLRASLAAERVVADRAITPETSPTAEMRISSARRMVQTIDGLLEIIEPLALKGEIPPLPIVPRSDLSMSRAKVLARHEQIHVAFKSLPHAVYQALDQAVEIYTAYPGLKRKAPSYLIAVEGNTPRNLRTRVEEVFAHILSGDWESIGLTEDQAIDVLVAGREVMGRLLTPEVAGSIFAIGKPGIVRAAAKRGGINARGSSVEGTREGARPAVDGVPGAGDRRSGGAAQLPPRPEIEFERAEESQPAAPARDLRITSLDDERRTALIELSGRIYRRTSGYGEWSSEMVAKAGQGVAPYLKSAYGLADQIARVNSLPRHEKAAPTEGKETKDVLGGRIGSVSGTANEVGGAGDHAPTEGGGPVGPDATQPGGTGGVDTRPVQEGQLPAGGGVGTGVGGLGPATVGGGRPGVGGTGSAAGNAGFYRITAADHLGEGEWNVPARLADNIAAIKLLKSLESDARLPTEDERKVLVRYVGWGGMAQQVFGDRASWRNREAVETAGLTPEETSKAKRSGVNAHYTSPPVIKFLWALTQRLGFTGGAVLEPALGVGHFMGLAPDAIVHDSNFVGVEMDPITARIAQYLYPGAQIINRPYQNVAMPDGTIDLAISNVPFNVNVHDKRYRIGGDERHPIANYYFVKSLDKVRPGGLVVFITSHYTMDSHNPQWRQQVAARADLVVAYRLPNTAFEQNAGTSVTTDILVFQKRNPGVTQGGEKFTEAVPFNADHKYNEYFATHPENMFGRLDISGKMYATGRKGTEETFKGEITLEPTEPLERMMADALQRAPSDIMSNVASAPPMMLSDADEVSTKELGYAVRDGRLVQRVSGQLRAPLNAELSTEPAHAQMVALVGIRDAVQKLITLQKSTSDDAALTADQAHLNSIYDAYVKEYGPLNGRATKIFKEDPQYPLLLSLEDWDSKAKTAEKTDIFIKRTIPAIAPLTAVSADVGDALNQILAERGFPDIDLLASLAHKPIEEITQELLGRGLIFRDPESSALFTSTQYLSGRVRDKLATARDAASRDSLFQPNVDALEKVQPVDRPAENIQFNLGTAWIPAIAYRQFVADVLLPGTPAAAIEIERSVDGRWRVRFNASPAQDDAWGARGIGLDDLFEIGMNLKRPTIRHKDADGVVYVDREETMVARNKLNVIKAEFQKWARRQDNPQSAPLTRRFNETFNATVIPEYNGSHLALPGSNVNIQLHPHQKDGAWRIVQDMRALIGHEVGTGKTMLMIAAAMELKRMGLAKKPMIVVPNNKVMQWGSDFLNLYPGANILVIGPDDLGGDRRRTMTARIATGNYDAVILQHSSFELIPISPEHMQRTINEELQALEDALRSAYHSDAQEGRTGRNRSPNVKKMEKQKANLEAKLAELTSKPKDNTIHFDDLGVDFLFIDEIHEFKNAPITSKMDAMSGLPTGQEVAKAFDMKAKTDFVRSLRGGSKGVVGATGTPITKSIVEAYTMAKYIAPDLLLDAGIKSFDDWAAQFGTAKNKLAVSNDSQTFEIKTMFGLLENAVPELHLMWRAFADMKYANELGLPRPEIEGGRPQTIVVPSNDVIEPMMEALLQRAQYLRANPRSAFQKGADNWFKIIMDGKAIALDPRIVDHEAADHPDSKSNAVIANILRVYNETAEAKSTQVAFAERFRNYEKTVDHEGVSHNTGKVLFDLFADMKRKLVAGGIPANEIAFAHDYTGNEKSQELYDALNSGTIRVVLGTTAKLGVGANFQKRLAALYNMDYPWNPDLLEQRIGRIHRQGNETQGKIKVLNYVTRRSWDGPLLQKLEQKASERRALLQHGKIVGDPYGDITLQLEEMMAHATDNPDAMRLVVLHADIMEAETMLHAAEGRRWSIRGQIDIDRRKIDSAERQLPQVESVLEEYGLHAAVMAAQEHGALPMLAAGSGFHATRQSPIGVIGSQTFTSRDEFVKYVDANHAEAFAPGTLATVYGVRITFEDGGTKWKYDATKTEKGGIASIKESSDPGGIVAWAGWSPTAGAPFILAARKMADEGTDKITFTDGSTLERTPVVRYLLGNEWHDVPKTGSGFLTSLVTMLRNGLPKEAESLKTQIATQKREIAALEANLAGLGEEETRRLAELTSELEELQARLTPQQNTEESIEDADDAPSAPTGVAPGSSAPQVRRGRGGQAGPQSGGSAPLMDGGPSEPARGRSPGLPTGPPAHLGVVADQISRTKILKELSEKLNIPVRVGRIRERARGIFKVKQEIVRTRLAADIATSAHEFGHAINKILWGTGKSGNLNWKPLAPYRIELAAIATQPRAGQSPLPEGFAEYIRMFLTNLPQAERRAPRFHAWFLSELDGSPELTQTLYSAQRDIATYLSLSPRAKIRAHIRTELPADRRNYWKRFYAATVDETEAMRAAVKALGSVPTEKNAHIAMRLFNGQVGRSEHFLHDGTFDPETDQVTGPGLASILKPLDGRLDELEDYMASRRAIEKSAQGIRTGIDIAAAREVVRLADPTIQDAARLLYEYQDELLLYLLRRGMITHGQYVAMKVMNRDFVPFYRALDSPGETVPGTAGTGRGFGNVSDAVRRMTGSDADILPPLESIIKNTYAMINLAERNRVVQLLVDHAMSVEGGGKILTDVPTPMRPTTLSIEKIKNDLEAAGVDLSQVALDTAITVFQPYREMGGRDNILRVVKDGVAKYYEVLDPELYRSIQNLDAESVTLLVKVLSVPASILRIGATITPEFSAIRNPSRDIRTAMGQSENGFMPWDFIPGLLHALKGAAGTSELYKEWLRAGGKHGAQAAMDRSLLQENLRDLLANPIQYGARHPLEVLRSLSGLFEDATRLGEYRLARKAGKSPMEAGFDSRNVTVDFQRRGYAMKSMNMITAFFGARLQGLDTFARSHANHPFRSFLRGFMGITVPALILYWINKDDEEYKDLPAWRRDFFDNFPTRLLPGGSYLREQYDWRFIPIPRPFEWGMVYGAAFERFATWYHGHDPDAFDDFMANLFSVINPVTAPTFSVPLIEAFADRSLFTFKPLTPSHLKRLSPEEQYQPWTSEFSKMAARQLAKIAEESGVDVRVSPLKLDNAIFGYTGGGGRDVLDITNPLLRGFTGGNAPASRGLADLPIMRALSVRFPSSDLVSIQEFHDRLDKLTTLRDTAKAVKSAAQLTPAEAFELKKLEFFGDRIADIRKQERAVLSGTLNPEQKRIQARDLDWSIMNLSRQAIGKKPIAVPHLPPMPSP